MKRSVNIVGAGVAGLATAIRLASKGHHVTVFEKSDRAGGKLQRIHWEGFSWDTGPTSFSFPDQLEELYVMAGDEMKTSIRTETMDIITKYFYEDGNILNAFSDPDLFVEEAEDVLGEPAENIVKHLERSKKIYDLTGDLFIFNTFYRFGPFMSQRFLKAFLHIWKLDSMVTMHDANSRQFKSKQLVQMFDWYATYNGSDPFRAPATLNYISHMEHNMGAYFPEKGMYSIASGLKELADQLGVIFHFNQPVEKVVMDKRVAQGVITEGGIYPSDIVVTDIDIFYLYRDLLEDIPFPLKHFKKERSTSALIFYWAMDREFPQLDLHNVLFSADYSEEFKILGHKLAISDDPSVYIFISSKKAIGDAPEGKENWYVMIHAPENLGQDWDDMIPRARKHILDKIKRILDTDVESHILHERIADPRTIEIDTASHRGAIYGNSSNSRTALFSRHPNFLRKYKGLFFVGGSVHPGGGLPLCLASAKIVDQHIH